RGVSGHAVHETRKRFKEIRGTLRLVREELGEETLQRSLHWSMNGERHSCEKRGSSGKSYMKSVQRNLSRAYMATGNQREIPPPDLGKYVVDIVSVNWSIHHESRNDRSRSDGGKHGPSATQSGP